jgi:Mg2+ and Co2+ transporter CorA
MLACDGTTTEETTILRPEELAAAREKWPVVWIDVEGLDDPAAASLIGRVFEIGELALEDAVTPDERPKVEIFGHQVLVAARCGSTARRSSPTRSASFSATGT